MKVLGVFKGLILNHLLTEFVYAVVDAFEKLIARFFGNQTQGRAFGNHVVQPMLGDFVEIAVVGTDEIERIVSDVAGLMCVGC